MDDLDYFTFRSIVDSLYLNSVQERTVIANFGSVQIYRQPSEEVEIKIQEFEYTLHFMCGGKAYVLPDTKTKSADIYVNSNLAKRVQRAFILHELVELEMMRTPLSKDERHQVAIDYERRYVQELRKRGEKNKISEVMSLPLAVQLSFWNS